ncbi:hypothetical protein JIQ42_03212 [Leishmania sp. Namibia]|uniref:hypothetical protein n=1 Tax=Leishmania sp. Namibia TaxID=2802991 RepID=UPI001B4FBA75|nr:hypothetical protein JIQ42_03212 [Leishmania sp. Namibia]
MLPTPRYLAALVFEAVLLLVGNARAWGKGPAEQATLSFLRKIANLDKNALLLLWARSKCCTYGDISCDARGDACVNLSGHGLDGTLSRLRGSFVPVVPLDQSSSSGRAGNRVGQLGGVEAPAVTGDEPDVSAHVRGGIPERDDESRDAQSEL